MDNKTIEALEKLIQTKDDTIKELEKQIQLLKNQPTINVPNLNSPLTPSPQPYVPVNPNPFVPINPIQTPSFPYSPYIISNGDPFPPGSIQSAQQGAGAIKINTNIPTADPNATWTFTTAEGSRPVDWFTASRC